MFTVFTCSICSHKIINEFHFSIKLYKVYSPYFLQLRYLSKIDGAPRLRLLLLFSPLADLDFKHKKNTTYLDDCGGIRVSLKGGGKQLDDARACS